MAQARVVFLAVALCALASPVTAQTLRIYQIDVEQADAALLVMPNGKTLLIDSGKNGHGQRIRNVMALAGVTQIDAFVNSHYHEDHFGGIDDLVDAGVPVLESYDRGDKACCVPPEKKKQPTYIDYQRTVGEDAIQVRPGDAINLDPVVTITVVAAGGVVIGETTPSDADDENDMSVALLINFRGFKAFFGGDIHAHAEGKIAQRDLVMDVDYYKGDHHGSHTSSSGAFMTDLRPAVVVLSNGNDGTYKHPRLVSLQTYAALMPAPTVFQVNKCFRPAPCGNVPDAQIADPQTSDEDGTILTTVNSATNTYTVAYGTTTRTFTVKAPVAGPVVSVSTVVISSLIPNPAGADEQSESVTIRNKGTGVVSLVGWTLQDRSGATWNLSGSIAAGASRTFKRNGQAMSLNNAGDEIVLLDGSNAERDRFAYSTSKEGGAINTQH